MSTTKDSNTFTNLLNAIDSGKAQTFLRFFKKELEEDTVTLNKLLFHAVLSKNIFFVQQLVSLGAKVVKLTENGQNCLHMAAKLGLVSTTEHLIKTESKVVNDVDESGNTALHLCQYSQDAKLITQCLLSAGVDTNIQNNAGETALMKAVETCNIGAVKLLIEAGADLDLTDLEGNSARSLSWPLGLENLLNIFDPKCSIYNWQEKNPLMKALTHENLYTFRIIVTSGVVDVNEKMWINSSNILYCFLKKKYKTLKNESESLDGDFWKCKTTFDCFSQRDYEVISLLVNTGAHVTDGQHSSLRLATKLGNITILKCILKNCNSDHEWLESAAEAAVLKGRCDLLTVLVETWKENNEPSYSSYSNRLRDVLQTAIKSNLEDCVSKTLEVSKLSNNDYYRALVCATTVSGFEIFKTIQNYDPQAFNNLIITKEGVELLCEASRNGHFEIVLNLLQLGVNRFLKDSSRYNPLVGVKTGQIAELLIQYGANVEKPDTIMYKSMTPLTPLMKALIENRCDVVKVLLNHNAKVDINHVTKILKEDCPDEIRKLIFGCDFNINEFDEDGRTALSLAIYNKDVKSIKILLEKGANVNLEPEDKPSECLPPLLAAVETHNISIIKMLLKHGAYINIVDREDKATAIMRAVRNITSKTMIEKASKESAVGSWDYLDIVKLLLKNGADVNIADIDGYTPFLYACYNSPFPVVSFLIDEGSDINISSRCGHTALMNAFLRNDDAIVTLLLEKGCDLYQTVISKHNDLALTKVAEKGNEANLRLLLDKGASINIGCKRKPLLVTTIAKNQFSCFCCLIEFGADVNVKYKDESLLTYLLKTRNVCNVSFAIHLLKIGAKVSSSESMFAVHDCIASGETELLSSLLHNGGFSPVIIDRQCPDRNLYYNDELDGFIEDKVCSPLFIALISGKYRIAQNIWKICFLTASDLNKLLKYEKFHTELEIRNLTKSLEVLNSMSSSVPTLFQLSFVKVSDLLGCEPGRREKVEQLQLPHILKRQLTFDFHQPVDISTTDSDEDDQNMNAMEVDGYNEEEPFEIESRYVSTMHYDDDDGNDVDYEYCEPEASDDEEDLDPSSFQKYLAQKVIQQFNYSGIFF